MGFIWNWLKGELAKLLTNAFSVILTIIQEMTSNNAIVNSITQILGIVAAFVWVIGIIILITNTVTSEHPDFKRTVNLAMGSSVFAFSFVTISKISYQLSTILASIVVNTFSNVENEITSEMILDSIYRMQWGVLFDVVLLLAMIVVLFVMMFRQIKRVVDILVYQMVGMLVVYDITTGNVGSFGTYVKGIVGLCSTQALELMLLYAGLYSMMQPLNTGVVFGFAFFLGAFQVGKKMTEWAHMGGSRGPTGVLRMTTRQTVNVIKGSKRFVGGFK